MATSFRCVTRLAALTHPTLRRRLLGFYRCRKAREQPRRVAREDLLPRFLVDVRGVQRFPGPVDAERRAVGAADDAVGAVQADRRFDRAWAEGVAVEVHLRLAKAH